MTIKKIPFQSYKLDEERAKEKYGRPFTVRLNQQEQEDLNQIKKMLDIKSDGTALKVAASSWLRCITTSFSPLHIKWLFKKERTRLSDYEDTDR